MQMSRSTTMKQLMTPWYRTPEFFSAFGQTGMSLRLSKASDIYSFAILAYELVHQQLAWENVNIGLIESVRNGQWPMISSHLHSWLSNLIRESWLMNPEDRPTAAAVSHILEDYFDSNDTVDDKTMEASEMNNTEAEFTLCNLLEI